MWGNIVLEVSFLTNFHLNFNNSRSDVLIHLIQWQYWWWFWFSYLWGLYFLLFLRIFRYRALKFKPRIATSFRPHGKWGDLIICLIPVSWCINIISNSNFILRMIEWQAESSLFTLRIRGRQWYWIYKYDLKILTDLLSTPKNIGHNKWQISTPTELQVADDYLHIMQLRLHNKWIKKYWSGYLDKTLKDFNFNVLSSFEWKKILTDFVERNSLSFEEIKHYPIKKPFLFNIYSKYNSQQLTKLYKNKIIFLDNSFNFTNKNVKLNIEKIYEWYSSILQETRINYLFNNHENFTEITRWTKKPQGSFTPVRLIKYPLLQLKTNKNENITDTMFKLRFNSDLNFKTKPVTQNNFLVLKQKRYKPLKVVSLKTKLIRNPITNKNSSNIKYSGKMTLYNNSIFFEDAYNSTTQYKLMKKYKKQAENIPVTLWKRLLRTKRTLVLPAHVNITVITNSYDVIHSWFIPGLGLKLDCVPGRATHHVLHIDNVGFYYGQCAEICGRYHHHMPIRICALPFEHFLIWWYTFGIPKLMSLGIDQRCYTKDYTLRKYIW